MNIIERDFDIYMEGNWYYKRTLVHNELNNQPIVIEARDKYELNEKINKAKEFLNREWIITKAKKEYERFTYERENLFKEALKEIEFSMWNNNVTIPLKIFSTEIIKYDDSFKPIGFYLCGDNGKGYREENGIKFYSDNLYGIPQESFFWEKLYNNIFKDEKELIKINQKIYKQDVEKNENIKRFSQLKEEQDIWQKEYDKTYSSQRLINYYLKNPSLIQKEAHNILLRSGFSNKYMKQPYDNKYLNYNIKKKKLALKYFLPSKKVLEDLLKEPNYEILKWEKSNKEEERIHLIWNQLILIAISEQFKADKLNLIDSVFIQGYAKVRSSISGNIEWKKVKILELFRKDFDKFILTELDANDCVEHYIKEYSKQMKNKENEELKQRLSTIEDTMVDISYSLEDIESLSTTHIETLNNNDGGVVNFKE